MNREHELHLHSLEYDFKAVAEIIRDHIASGRKTGYAVTETALTEIADAMEQTETSGNYYTDLPDGEIHEILEQIDNDTILDWIRGEMR